jgi:hypothetical protein
MLLLAVGQPERTAAIAGVVVLGLCMLCLTLYYCRNAPQIAAKFQRTSSSDHALLYRPVSRRLAWISAAALLALFPLPEIEAAVLDRRLRKVIQMVPLDRGSIDRITQTLQEADKYGVRLPLRTISAVQATLRKTSEMTPTLSDDAIKAASAAASTATIDIGLPPDMHGPMFSSLPEAKGSGWVFVPIATNTGPDNYGTIGIAREPDVAKMERIDSPVRVESQYGPAFLAVKGLTATLDGWHLKHVVFQDMRLIYNGGPLLLESVYFFRCQLQCAPNENSWRLISAVTKGGWISLSLQ